MNDSLQHQITRALTLSRELLSVAQRGEWSDFDRLYRQRDEALRQLDQDVKQALPLEPQEGEQVTASLQELKTLNNQILQLAQSRKNQLGGQARDSHRAQRAVDAYKK